MNVLQKTVFVYFTLIRE